MIGEIVNERYQVEELLKETPFVKTYRVKDISLDKPAILRVMYFSPDDFEEIPQYENQLKVFQQLYHPQIPRFLDSFFLPNDMRPVLCSLSQYIELTPLNQLLEEKGRFPEDEAIAFLIQLTRIIEYLHSLAPPFIHQALHPGNISIGQDNKLYLTGYTLVRKDAEGKLFPLEVSMDYTAPEQMKGIATPYSDLYAIGITGVEMVTGQKYNKIYRRDFQSQANISTDLVKVLQKLVEKDPENRYQSASALKNDLLNIQKAVQKKMETLNVDAELDKKQMVIPMIGIGLAVLAVLILLVRPFFRTSTPVVENQVIGEQTTDTSGSQNTSSTQGLSLDKKEVKTGDSLSIRYAKTPGNLRDWIAVVPVGLPENEWEAQFFLNGRSSGEIKYKAPSRVGDYEVRLYHDWPKGQYQVIEKQVFKVTGDDKRPKTTDLLPEATLNIYQDLGYQGDLPPGITTSQSSMSTSAKPKESLISEPTYSSPNVGYGYFLMGNGDDPVISYVVDGDKIYIDKNNNQDLSDDGEPLAGPGEVDLSLTLQDLQGSPQSINYKLWIFPSNMGGLKYYSKSHYAGNLNVKGQDYPVIAFETEEPDALYRSEGVYIDFDKNGSFSESEKVRHHSVLEIEGERYLFKLNNP